MKKPYLFKFDRTLLLAVISIFCSLPYILYYHGSLLIPLLGLAGLLLIRLYFTAQQEIREDPTAKDREKAVSKLLSSPFYILRNGQGGGAPTTPTDYSLSHEMRYYLCTWAIVMVVHLLSAIIIEEAIGGGFGRFYPLWLILFVIAVVDSILTFRKHKF